MVDIIPKQITETPRWQKILFYISIVLFILSIVAYGVVSYLEKKSNDYLREVNEKLSAEETVKITALEKEIIPYKEKIDVFASLFREHVLSSKFFSFLEQKTHPTVSFSGADISINPENIMVEFSGLTDSFLSLGQQLSIFNSDPMIDDVILSNIGLGRTGGIEFKINIFLKRQLLKY